MFGRKARRIRALEALTGADQAVIRCLDEQLVELGRVAEDRAAALRVYMEANDNLLRQQGRRQQLYLDLLEQNAELDRAVYDLTTQLRDLEDAYEDTPL